MGAWGVAIFSDDLAADIRGDSIDLIGDGVSTSEAVDKLIAQYGDSIKDEDDGPVFWLALAAVQWKLGRLEERTKREALKVIDSGVNLQWWEDAATRKKRAAVLAKLRGTLLSPSGPPKRVRRRIRSANEWAVGEVVGFRLASGKWIPLRVIGHHTDRGGRSAICELLDWTGTTPPSGELIAQLPVRRGRNARRTSQFFFPEPRKKTDQARVARWGITSQPAQRVGGFTVFIWPRIDELVKRVFDLE
jgi:hypothetical protein